MLRSPHLTLTSPSPSPFPSHKLTHTDETALIEQLPPALKHDVLVHRLSQTVDKLPLLSTPTSSYATVAFRLGVYDKLQISIREAKEIIIDHHSTWPYLYFLCRGSVVATGAATPIRFFELSKSGEVLDLHPLLHRYTSKQQQPNPTATHPLLPRTHSPSSLLLCPYLL